jgi:hypothetical protein
MSCLFNSLSFFLNEDGYTIRQKICDYLLNNDKIIDGLDTSFILNLESNNYIQNMRSTNTWGGAIEIQSACNLYNVNITIRNYRDNNGQNIEFIPVTNQATRIIELEWTGGHYEPVRK